MKLRTLVLVVSLPAVLSACASSGNPFAASGGPDGSPGARPYTSGSALSIEVSNNYYLPVRIWVDWPGDHHFVGSVGVGGSQIFQIPASLVRRYPTLRLYADGEGSTDFVRTDPLKVLPGQHVSWRLRKTLDSSRAYVM